MFQNSSQTEESVGCYMRLINEVQKRPFLEAYQIKADPRSIGNEFHGPDWSRPSKLDQNPMAWMIRVNGLIIDACHLPREIQEIAFRNGLIPYIPES